MHYYDWEKIMNYRLVVALGALIFSGNCLADHSWSTYHWARTTLSFDLTVVNSTTSDWTPYVSDAMNDWSMSTKLNMVEEEGDKSANIRRRCRAPKGKLRICNDTYGNNGWLGIAGISIDGSGHITKGYTKLNDTYFSPSYEDGYYYTPAWKQSVACQELGHNIGLDHQDENFHNQSLFSCMDYQDPPFEFPNDHDFEQLESIYEHLDSSDSDDGTCNAPPGKGCNKAGAKNNNGWGKSMGRRGNAEVFIRTDQQGIRHLTHVTWINGH